MFVIAENETAGMNLGLETEEFDVRMLITPLRALAKSENLWRLRSHAKGDVILHHGAPSGDIFILETGLLKLVYPTANGDEWIKSFIVDQGVFGSLMKATWPNLAVFPRKPLNKERTCVCRSHGCNNQSPHAPI